MTKDINITEAEWAIMKVVWAAPSVPASHIVAALADEKDWNHRTVKTLLARLVKKGALNYSQEGNRYLYSPALSRDEAVLQESQSFIERVFDGISLPMLAQLVKKTRMSPEEIEALKALLASKEKEYDDDGDA